MSDIPPIKGAAGSVSMNSRWALEGLNNGEKLASPASNDLDSVEISEAGQLLSTLEPDTDIRIDKVLAIRQAIVDGTYDTESRLEAILDDLLEIVRQD